MRDEHDAEHRERRRPRRVHERADQHQELGDERRQAGQRQRGQAGDQEQAGQHRGDLLHAAEVVDLRRAAARDQVAGDQEQRGRREAVVEHVEVRTRAGPGCSSRRCPAR